MSFEMYEFFETKIRRKIKTMLYGYRQLYSLHKNIRHLGKHKILLNQDFILQIMNYTDIYQKQKVKS